MRVSKEGTIRRDEFLAVSLRLFSEKGYDETTVNDIIQAVGVSKGAFYHYFSSKEEVLKSLASNLARPFIDIATEAACSDSMDAPAKLNRLIRESLEYRARAATGGRQATTRDIINDRNLRLRSRADQIVLELALPFIAAIIGEGVREGTFGTEFPREVAEMYIHIARLIRDSVQGWAEYPNCPLSDLKTRAEFYEDALTRLLGARPGSIDLASRVMDYAEALFRAHKVLPK